MKKLLVLAFAFAVLSLPACGVKQPFQGKVSIVSTADGPGFDPAVLIAEGKTGTLSVINTLDKDHGFKIDELKVEKVVHPGETVDVKLSDLQSIDYEFYCQLHDLKTGKGKHRRGLLRLG